jgi:hypothetical protein
VDDFESPRVRWLRNMPATPAESEKEKPMPKSQEFPEVEQKTIDDMASVVEMIDSATMRPDAVSGKPEFSFDNPQNEMQLQVQKLVQWGHVRGAVLEAMPGFFDRIAAACKAKLAEDGEEMTERQMIVLALQLGIEQIQDSLASGESCGE